LTPFWKFDIVIDMGILARLKKDSAYVAKDLWGSLFKVFHQDTLALKLMAIVISKINPQNATLEDLKGIKIPLSELYDGLGFYGANKLANIKRTIKRVFGTFVDIETDNSWQAAAFFDIHTTLIDKRNGFFHVDICDGFLPFLANLSRFLQIRISTTRLSNRCFVFYCVLMENHKKHIYNMSVDKIKGYCNVNYSNYGLFKQKFLLPVISELADVGIKITFGEQKIGNRVESLNFTISEDTLIATVEEQKLEDVPLLPTVPESRIVEKDTRVQEIYDYYMQVFKRDPMYKLTKPREAVIAARLKEGFSVEHCKGQIDFIKNSPFHNGTDPKGNGTIYNDLVDIVFNKTKFDKRIEQVNKKVTKKIAAPVGGETAQERWLRLDTARKAEEKLRYDKLLESYESKGVKNASI
jgi:hypothetical protein